MLTEYSQNSFKKILKPIFLPTILVSLILFSHIVFAEQQPGLEISEITISGNKRVETELIDLNIKTKPEDIYNLEKLRDDLKNVYRLGYFENVYLETEEKNGKIHVFFVLDEKPVIIDLRLSGNDKVKEKDLNTVLTIREGEIIDLKKVETSLDGIRNLYSQKAATRAKHDGNGWRLDGTKRFVSAVDIAQRLIVPATTDEGEKAAPRPLVDCPARLPETVSSFEPAKGRG